MHSIRRLLAVLVTAVCVVGVLAAGAGPAHAAPSGYLLMKGTGSVYSANTIINQGGIPGGTARSFSYKVVNTGSTSQQFKVTLSPFAYPGTTAQVTSTLLLGSTVLPTPYYPVPVAPGKSVILTLQVKVAAGAPQGEYGAQLLLRDPETGSVLDSGSSDVNATYQTGNTSHDLFLKTGTQPYVGGSYGQQFETANALKVGVSASYLLRLQNNSGSPAAITLSSSAPFACAESFTAVVKQGTADVTAAVAAGTYSTGILGPGARKDLKLTVKMVAPSACTGLYFTFTSSSPSGSTAQSAHVVTGA